MRSITVWLLLTTGLVSPAIAEDVHVLPEIVIGGGAAPNAAPAPAPGGGTMIGGAPPAPTTASERCVEVEIGSSRAMNCLNQKLKHEVDRVNPTLNLPPIDARSPDTKVGVVNIPAVQQQYGRNFGVSAVPYRPPPLTFSSPMGRR